MVQSGSLTMRTTIKVGGAIIVSDSKVWINGTQFEGNSAELGGTLFIERSSNVSIQNSLFHFHSTRPTYYYHKSGGMIYALETSLNISSCFFVANTAQSKGAVLYTVKDDFTIIINSTFMNNTVTSGRSGVIYSTANGSFYVVSSTFTGNTATSYGGVIHNSAAGGSFRIVDSTFTGNTATSYGGVIYNSAADGFFHIVHSNFTDNTATLSGGVICNSPADDGSFHIVHSNFAGNMASRGGVIADYGGSFYIATSSFTHNKVIGFKSIGGVIDVYGYGLIQINDSTLIHNKADTGGVLYAFRTSLYIMNSTFSENNATEQGIVYLVGGLFPEDSIPTYKLNNLNHIDNSTFSGNTALGSIVSFYYASVKISGRTSFVNNNGSLYIHYSNLTVMGLSNS